MSRSRLAHQRGSGQPIAPGFSVPAAMLEAVSLPAEWGGVILGSGRDGEPLAMSVLRPTPTRVILVGGLYLARQVAMRAMAAGAWITVATGRPGTWQVLARAAGQDADGTPAPTVKLRGLVPAELPPACEDAPLLVLHDGGAVPQELFPPRSPWQTTLYLLPYLHQHAAGTAGTADLVLLQRLPAGQAQLAARIWRLPPPLAQQLTTLRDDEVVALGRNLWLPVRLVSATEELRILGPVRRGD